MEEIFKKEFDSIKKILHLISDQVERIHVYAESFDQLDDPTSTVYVAKLRYLNFFVDVGEFIVDKLYDDPDKEKNARFFMPNLRTLIEIKILLLYLETKNLTEQKKLLIGDELFTLSRIINTSFSGQDSELESFFKQRRATFLPFFNTEKIDVPQDPYFVKLEEMRKQDLYYPTIKYMTGVDLKSMCPESVKKFPKISKNPYAMFSNLSNYVHGNSLFGRFYKNDIFWIISQIQIISAQVFEVIEEHILDNSKLSDFKTWLEDLDKQRPKFMEHWKARKKIEEMKVKKLINPQE